VAGELKPSTGQAASATPTNFKERVFAEDYT
jgi:hypothetical protein